ncbi:MAG: hypothetical protein IJS90_07080 [Clostridia bacterium]|nr:hypothetical protein [Clostridia bacterium]
MKLTGLLCVCLSVALSGAYLFRRAAKRTAVLELFSEYFAFLSSESESSGGDLKTLLENCALKFGGRFPFAEELRERYGESGDIPSSWISCAAKYSGFIKKNEREAVDSFSGVFGSLSKKEFRGECERRRRKLGEESLLALQKLKTTGKLTVAFSSLLAALVFIIFI